MSSIFRPWQMFVVTAAGWINRDQQAVIHYLQEENRILREHLGKKRLLLTNDQRRRLAAKGKLLGRRLLGEIGMIFFGERSLRRAVTQYLAHYHAERNHQGLDNQLIDPSENVGDGNGAVQCRERLGGMLRYYYRQAA